LRAICIAIVATSSIAAQVSYQRLVESDGEPGNWLTYSGGYQSHRHSGLDQLTRDNVGRLQLQ